MPLPPVCSIVNVYSTTLPARSVTVMFVVEPTRVADALVSAGAAGALSVGLPAGTAPAGACGPISGARSAADESDSRARRGAVENDEAPSPGPRAANAKRDAPREAHTPA